MTNPGTGTQTRTTSITMTDVRHVLWRMASDLRTLRVLHNLITPEREVAVVEDLMLFIYRNYIDAVEFRFVDAANVRRYAAHYALTRAWSGSDDDESGGLRFVNVSGTRMMVIVSYSATWKALPASNQQAFRQLLKATWGPVAAVSDAPGSWSTDKTYGSGGLGATRSVFGSR